LGKKKAKRNEQVCVLVKRQEYIPRLPGRRCAATIHQHCSYENAEYLEQEGMAEWIYTAIIETASGTLLRQEVPENFKATSKQRKHRELAIRLIPRRRWTARPSRDERGTMKTLQLVP
jgi:hypothetical protein